MDLAGKGMDAAQMAATRVMDTLTVLDPFVQMRLNPLDLNDVGMIISNLKGTHLKDAQINLVVKALFVTHSPEDLRSAYDSLMEIEDPVQMFLLLATGNTTQEQAAAMVAEADLNADGLEYDEFCYLSRLFHPPDCRQVCMEEGQRAVRRAQSRRVNIQAQEVGRQFETDRWMKLNRIASIPHALLQLWTLRAVHTWYTYVRVDKGAPKIGSNTANEIMRQATAKETQRVMTKLVHKHNIQRDELIKEKLLIEEHSRVALARLQAQCVAEKLALEEKARLEMAAVETQLLQSQQQTRRAEAELEEYKQKFEEYKRALKEEYELKIQNIVDDFGDALDKGV